MSEDLKWLIGALLAIAGMIAAAWRVLSDRQHTGDNQLHERINRVREELAQAYVRKSDLDGHLSRIDKSVQDLRDENREMQRETNRRLDAIIQAVSTKRGSA